jgi:hypothetical protein
MNVTVRPHAPTSSTGWRAASAATAAVVGALGGRELAVLATALALTVHLEAARLAPDVAVHISAHAATSAGKELHAAVAVRLVEVKEPAVEVVAGCLKALVDLLHGLVSAGCGGSGGGDRVRVALHPRASAEQLAADGVLAEEAARRRRSVGGGAKPGRAGESSAPTQMSPSPPPASLSCTSPTRGSYAAATAAS